MQILRFVDEDGEPMSAERVAGMTREQFRVTSIGKDGQISGERWDERQQRYRPIKPFALTPTDELGLSMGKVSIEFADEEQSDGG